MKINHVLLALLLLMPEFAQAASFESTLQSLVSAVVSKIMPLCALPFVAKTALGWVRGDAQAVQQLPTVVIGVVALLGINGVWAFLQSHVH